MENPKNGVEVNFIPGRHKIVMKGQSNSSSSSKIPRKGQDTVVEKQRNSIKNKPTLT